jgi:hypothetical protein
MDGMREEYRYATEESGQLAVYVDGTGEPREIDELTYLGQRGG